MPENKTELERFNNEKGGKILTFMSDGKIFAFDVFSVADITPIPPITKIPRTPDYLSGVINHHGKAVPVMDLRKRIGFPDYEYTPKSCVIIVEINSMQIGFTVDEVLHVSDVTPEKIIPSPATGGIVQSYIQLEDERVSLLNSEKMVRTQKGIKL